MKCNNKGFAISIMLYAMVLLIVTIFYIILAIVKSRYTTSEVLVDTAMEFMKTNDSYASASDQAAPLIVFNKYTMTVKNSLSGLVIWVFDDNIKSNKIEFTVNDNKVSLTCTGTTTKWRCVPAAYTINTSANLKVTATDVKGNVSTETIKFNVATAPTCTPQKDIAVIDEKTCHGSITTCSKLSKDGVVYKLFLGDYVTYVITCTSNSGLDAFFNDSDLGSLPVQQGSNLVETLGEYKITTERSPGKVIIKITARGLKLTDLTRVRFGKATEAGQDNPLKVCDGYKGTDASNCVDIDLPYVKVLQCTAANGCTNA